ncbi:MAG: class I SAM-dependent methyltransferase [Pseudomonadales bacterium]
MRDYNKEYQDSTGRRYAYDFDWVVRKYLLHAWRPFFRLADSALELGSFQGDMTRQILEIFPDLTVIEASSDLCSAIEERFPGKLRVINATFEVAMPPERYANVFIVHTLEHLDEPVQVLSRVKQWLKPGGRLFVAVPNANALSRQIAVKMGLIGFNAAVTEAEREHGHRRTYTLDSLHHDLRQAGLSVTHSGGALVKALANFQFDKALAAGIVDDAYLDGCFELGKLNPDICASIYAVCEAK